MFDSSYGRGQPLSFPIGQRRVIPCWEQGLLNMCPGEVRELTCQPSAAYGERGIGPIPPNAVLIFKAELVDIAGVDVAEPKTEEQAEEDEGEQEDDEGEPEQEPVEEDVPKDEL